MGKYQIIGFCVYKRFEIGGQVIHLFGNAGIDITTALGYRITHPQHGLALVTDYAARFLHFLTRIENRVLVL